MLVSTQEVGLIYVIPHESGSKHHPFMIAEGSEDFSKSRKFFISLGNFGNRNVNLRNNQKDDKDTNVPQDIASNKDDRFSYSPRTKASLSDRPLNVVP